jgi:hypothetical protein
MTATTDTTATREPFSVRIGFIETRSVAEELERRAVASGHSVSDEVRAALRAYLSEKQR